MSEADAARPRPPADAERRDGSAPLANQHGAAPDAEAVRAYSAALEAYATKDAAAYFDAFAVPMACFYGDESTARDALEEARRTYFGSTTNGTGPLATMAIVPVRVSADEVVLVHWGIHRDGPGKRFVYPLFSRKAVVMTAFDGRWKIAAEFSFGTSRCYGDVFRGVETPRCVRGMGSCMTSCCKPAAGEVTEQCEFCERQCADLYEACLGRLE